MPKKNGPGPRMTTEATMVGTTISAVAAAATETLSPTGPTFAAMSSSFRMRSDLRRTTTGGDIIHNRTFGKVGYSTGGKGPIQSLIEMGTIFYQNLNSDAIPGLGVVLVQFRRMRFQSHI